MDLHGLAWETPFKKTITIATAAFAFVAAAGGAVKAWPDIEPYVPAHRGYARAQLAQLTPTLNQVLLYQAQDSRAKIEEQIASWLIKLPTEQDQQTRVMITGRVQQLKAELGNIDERIKQLGGQ